MVHLSVYAACHLLAVDELAPLIQRRTERRDLISQSIQSPEDLHRAIVDEMSLQGTPDLILRITAPGQDLPLCCTNLHGQELCGQSCEHRFPTMAVEISLRGGRGPALLLVSLTLHVGSLRNTELGSRRTKFVLAGILADECLPSPHLVCV